MGQNGNNLKKRINKYEPILRIFFCMAFNLTKNVNDKWNTYYVASVEDEILQEQTNKKNFEKNLKNRQIRGLHQGKSQKNANQVLSSILVNMKENF